jgi:predicted enzyme related to lactoylglutathione lyase
MMDNKVTYFEVATDDPEGAQRFYGGLFGWTFGTSEAGSLDYRMIGYPGGEPGGGLFNTKGEFHNHAVFYVQVADVETACGEAESLGGKVVKKLIDVEDAPDFAYLQDTSGNLFAIFRPA